MCPWGCYNIPFGVIMKSCNLEKDIGKERGTRKGVLRYKRLGIIAAACEITNAREPERKNSAEE